MPRTRRAAAPDVTAMDAPVTHEAAALTPDTPNVSGGESAPSGSETQKKPRPRRTKRPSAPENPAQETMDLSAAGASAAETSAPPESAPPKRRATRRKAQSEAAAAESVQPAAAKPGKIPLDAPAAENAPPQSETAASGRPEAVPPGRQRRRGARAAASAQTPPAETAGTAPRPASPSPEAQPAPGGARQRRRGPQNARRAEGAEAPIESAADQSAVPQSAPESAAPEKGRERASGGRRRRRRGAETVEIAESEAEALIADMGLSPITEPAAESEEEETRRSRRSRRGRRRRGSSGDSLEITESVDLLVGDEVQTEIEEEEEDVSLYVLPPPPPVYVAPPIVPPVYAPAPESAPARVTASLETPEDRSLARISVNGTLYTPHFFFVNAETAHDGEVVDSQIRQAAAAGIHLYSSVMYLPLKNAYGDRSFGAIDGLLQQTLAADPQAYILPRLQFVPTNYWARTHPDQMAHYADGSEGDVSLASTEFWSDCIDALDALITHLSDPATVGGDRVIGFHLDRGEWFYDAHAGPDLSEPNQAAFRDWLHAKYQLPYALRAAWFDGSVTFDDASIPVRPSASATKKGETPLYSSPRDRRWIDYSLFSSELTASVITGLAEAIKTLSFGRLIVAASYGYILEFAARNDSGHLALAKVLASPHIDIVAGPNTYYGRGAGNPAAFGAPVDSVALHGKLWLVEDDTKTFLAETETDDTYNPKIVSGADTQAAHQRHFGAALAHQAGVSWMDLWGQGWLDNPEIWKELGGLRNLADRWSHQSAERSAPDVVVFVDEASLAHVKNDPTGLGIHLIGKTRDLLLRAGASFGFYLQSDVAHEKLPDAKLYLFLNALRLTATERNAVRERLQRPGKTLAWLYAPGIFDEKGLSSQDVSEVVGIGLRLQPWNSKVGSQLAETRHPITERVRTGKRIGQDEILNPSYSVYDAQATALAHYTHNGAPSLAVREHHNGWKSVFVGDPHLTVDLLRGLYNYSGVHLYDTQDDVAYASNDGVLLLHAPFTGQRTVNLPRKATVYDAMDHKIVAVEALSFRTFLRARTTRLYLWGDSEAISRISGLPLPEISSAPDSLPEMPETGNDEEAVTAAAPASPAGHLQKIPGLDDAALDYEDNGGLPYPSNGADEEIAAEETGGQDGEGQTEPRTSRSRWQRRRAAARARRDAERRAKSEAPGEAGNAAGTPVDIASILPNLPPRRKIEIEGSPADPADPES